MTVSTEGHYAVELVQLNGSTFNSSSARCLVLRNASVSFRQSRRLDVGEGTPSLGYYSRARQYSTLLISHMNLSACPNLGTDMIPTSLPHGINILSRLGTTPHNRVVTR
jgi:hypothetical protein